MKFKTGDVVQFKWIGVKNEGMIVSNKGDSCFHEVKTTNIVLGVFGDKFFKSIYLHEDDIMLITDPIRIHNIKMKLSKNYYEIKELL